MKVIHKGMFFLYFLIFLLSIFGLKSASADEYCASGFLPEDGVCIEVPTPEGFTIDERSWTGRHFIEEAATGEAFNPHGFTFDGYLLGPERTDLPMGFGFRVTSGWTTAETLPVGKYLVTCSATFPGAIKENAPGNKLEYHQMTTVTFEINEDLDQVALTHVMALPLELIGPCVGELRTDECPEWFLVEYEVTVEDAEGNVLCRFRTTQAHYLIAPTPQDVS